MITFTIGLFLITFLSSISGSHQATCDKIGSWHCDSEECIRQYRVCDGEENCKDGSDETNVTCINFPCPSSVGFRCGYGACIDKDRKCDGTKDCKDGSDEVECPSSQASGPDSAPNLEPPISGKDCLLPDYPRAGDYQVITGCESGEKVSLKCRAVPGTPVPLNTLITYSCTKGFSLDSNISESICLNGNWFPRTLSCLRLCMPLESKSLTINCTYKGSPVDCTSQYVLPGTKANFKCKRFYHRSGFTYGSSSTSFTTTCNSDGLWSESLFRCKPKCGIRNKNDIEALISDGSKTSAVEYPWHAGLYKFDTEISGFAFFCGGTVITPSMILTAAHCIYDLRSQPEELKVAVGKTTRTWEIMDLGEQRFNVTKVFIHYDYSGHEHRYAFDIAILQLNQYIVIGTIAMPICLETIRPWTIENGTMGTVVGWGTNEAGVLSQELMVAHLPYLDLHSCKAIAGPSFRDFVTRDKFCGKINPKTNALVQKGDSGGGFIFYKETNQQYFIRGIVSTKPTKSNNFATFTNISEETHMRFLKSVITTS